MESLVLAILRSAAPRKHKNNKRTRVSNLIEDFEEICVLHVPDRLSDQSVTVTTTFLWPGSVCIKFGTSSFALCTLAEDKTATCYPCDIPEFSYGYSKPRRQKKITRL